MMRSTPTHRGFTLTEMVVVIAIIVVLAGLTMAVLPAIMGQSDARRTNSAIELLDTAIKEWETTAERKLRWSRDDESPIFNVEIEEPVTLPTPPEDAAKNQTIAALRILERNAEIRELLTGIEADMLRRLDPDDPSTALRVVDPWDQPIIIIHPGRTADDEMGDNLNDADADGTVRTELENVLGICLNRQVCIVSAGPDGRYGNLHLDTALGSLSQAQQEDVDAAADNIYSYDIGKGRP